MTADPSETKWKGQGRTPVTRHRADLILAALAEADRPLTTQEVAKATGLPYHHVYQGLRRMCGDHTRLPGQCSNSANPSINMPGFPVIWHSWFSVGQYVTWELVPEYRTERQLELALLSAAWGLQTGGA